MADYSVKTYAELVDAINAANTSVENDTIALTDNIIVAGVLPTLGIRDAQGNVIASGDLTIHGNDHTLSGGGQHRLLFANAGTITVDALVLDQGLAKGGDGGDGRVGSGGGGGMGAGGGLYVRQGASVTLTDVTVGNSAAQGGNGGADGFAGGDGSTSGGGGGLGGDGGDATNFRNYGGGGGAFEGQTGGSVQAENEGTTGGGPNGSIGVGGDFSGGGGGISSQTGIIRGSNGGYGGGGGGGGAGSNAPNSPTGGDGGFGGGGGGGGGGRQLGDGGGGPGDGGFGGGGGGQTASTQFGATLPAQAGFGAGNGGEGFGKSAGGGGAAFGAGIFVQEGGSLTIAGSSLVSDGSLTAGRAGSFTGTTASERAPQDGQTAGSSLFLQGSGTLTYAPNAGQSISIFGSIEDQVGFVARTGYAPEAGTWSGTERWGLSLDGPGTLMLTSNTYSGGTTIHDGRLKAMDGGAIGTGNVVFDAGAGRFGVLALFGAAEPVNTTLSNTLVDFGYGSALELMGLAYTGPGSTTATVSNGVLTVANQFMFESFSLGGQSGSNFAAASNGNNGTVVGVATTGQISVTDGMTYNHDSDRDVTLVVYSGTELSYTASVTGTTLSVDNGRVSEAINLGTGAHGLSLDFSTNTVAVSLSGGDYGDSLRGGSGGDTLAGGGGGDTLDGGLGADSMTGGIGNDTYIVDNAGDQVFEATGGGVDRVFVRPSASLTSYTLAAGQEVEVLATTRVVGGRDIDLTGNETGQNIFGNAGANVLDGKAGADQLIGGGGADTFVFSTALGANNVDRIVDFSSGDIIRLSKSIFTELDLGTLSEGAFKDLGAQGATVDANDHILYDGKGRLFYDADGAGGEDAVLFARISYRPTLSHDDYFVV